MKQTRVHAPCTKYIVFLFLAVLLTLCMLCPAAQAEDPMGERVDLSLLADTHILTDGTYHLTGATTHPLIVGGTVTLWLDNASIQTAGATPALTVTDSANVHIRLVGENHLTASATRQSALLLSAGASVVIGTSEDEGSLAMQSGLGASGVAGAGTLTIAGGTIHAQGGSLSAGIGCGVVRIAGGLVTAQGGDYGAGIGGKSEAQGGVIEITGGTVFAQGGEYAPGIGSGAFAEQQTAIYIRGGSVKAVGGNFAEHHIDVVKRTTASGEVASVPIALKGWKAGDVLGSLKLSAGEYGAEQMIADADGAFHLWLPAGTIVRRVQVGEKTYLFSLAEGTSGTYSYATTDTVLDVSEGQVTVSGDDTSYTITGTQTATDEPILINGAVVTFYNLNAKSQVQISGDTRLHFAGENVLEGTTAAPMLFAPNSVGVLTGSRLTIRASSAPAMQAVNAVLQLGTTVQAVGVEMYGGAGYSTIDGIGGKLTLVSGFLEVTTPEGDPQSVAISVAELHVKAGELIASAQRAGVGVRAETVLIEGGTVTASGAVAVRATTVTIKGGGNQFSGGDAAISATSITVSGGEILASVEDGTGAAIGSESGAGACTVTISGGKINAGTNGTGAAIGSGAGSAACQITITGGRVQANAHGGGAAIGGGATVSGGGVTINGGTILANAHGGGAAIGGGKNGAAGTVKINGGNVHCEVMGTEVGNPIGGGYGQSAAAPVNDAGKPLFATYVTGIARDLPVTEVTTKSGAVYGVADLYPFDTGAICVWIPAQDAVVAVKNAEKTHKGAVLAGTTGKCAADAVTLPLQGTVIIDAYGYQIGTEPHVEHAGDYLLKGTGTLSVTLRGVKTTLTLENASLTGNESPVLKLLDSADVTLCLVGENRITAQDSICVTVDTDSLLTLKNGISRGSLVLEGGAESVAIFGSGSILQESGSVFVNGGSGAKAMGLISYTIKGGLLYLTDGAGATASNRNLTVCGGMVVLPAEAMEGVQNTNGTALLPIWVRGLPANTPVTACSLAGYGTADLYTDSAGALCLWATADTALTSVTVDGTIYKCNLVAGSEGVARKYYTITFYEDADGNRVTADVTEAYEGQTVTLTVTPGENRKSVGVPAVILDGVSYSTVRQADGYTFVMPLGAVSLTCNFAPIVITVPAGETQTLAEMSIDADQKLVVQGTLIVTDVLENVGVIEIAPNGTLEVQGVLTNHGVVENMGSVLLGTEATLENAGTVNTAGRFENNGKLIAHLGSTFENTGDYAGDGAIEGDGKVLGVGLPVWAILLIAIVSTLAVIAIGVLVWKSSKKKLPAKATKTEET